MKKRTVVSLILAVVMMFLLSATAFSAESTDAPVLDVAAKNLSLNNTIDLLFYVTIENGSAADVRLMTWTTAQTDYAYGTQEQILEPTVITTYKQKPCAIFYYTGLAAKQMADNVYVRAFTEKGDVMYFSDVDKYSILQYAYNKIHAASPDAKLVPLLEGMLDYGAQAQVYFNYNSAHPANADFKLVKLANGLLSDKTDRGLFLAGETATLVAPAYDAAGVPFSYWKNSAGERVGTTATLNLTVTAADTYTAVYEISDYDVTVVNGTVDGVTSGKFKDGSTVTLEANAPAEGYVFSHWTNAAGATVGTTATLNVTVKGAETYTANYKLDSYTVSVVNGSGSGTYEYGSTAKLVANAPAANYVFSHWTNAAGATVGTNATLNVTVKGAETYTAVYKLASYTISVKNGSGSGTYEYGSTVTLVANAAATGREFSHWTNAAGKNVGESATLTVTVTGNETYTAVYNDLFEYTLLDDGTYEIALKDTTALVDGTIVIPSVYDGVAVTAIAENGFANRTDLTSIVIPENITVIGKNAFAGCTALESLSFVKTSYWSAGALEFAPTRAADSAIMAEFITGTYAAKEWTYSATSSEGSYTKPY